METDTLNSTNVDNIQKDPDFKIALGNNKFLLPGGVRFGGRLLRTVTLRPTNGYDEEAIGTTEVSGKASRVTTVILSRTITAIEDIVDPNAIERIVPTMLCGDRSALLFMLTKISTGDIVPMDAVCPNKHSFRYDYDIDKMTYDAYPAGAPETISAVLKDGLKNQKTGQLERNATLRLALGTDELSIEDAGEHDLLKRGKLLELCLLSVGDLKPVNPIYVKQMSSRDRTILLGAIDKWNPGPHTVFTARCTTCNTQTRGRALAGNFFGG